MESLIYVGRSLLALVVMIYFANWALRRLNRLQQQNDTKGIKIMERHPVSKSSSLAIVDVMGVYYLMSCSDSGNTILEKLDETEVAALLERKRRRQTAGRDALSLQTRREKIRHSRLTRQKKGTGSSQ